MGGFPPQTPPSAHANINIPPSGSRSDQYPPILGLSPARHYMDMIFVARRGVNTNLRAGEIWRVSPDTSGATAGTICRGAYNFCRPQLPGLCYKMSSYLVIQRHQQLTILKTLPVFQRIFGSHDEIPGYFVLPARFARGKSDCTHTRRLVTRLGT